MKAFFSQHSFSLSSAAGWLLFTFIAFQCEPGAWFDTWQGVAGAFGSGAIFAIMARHFYEADADPTVKPK